jgi:hypothetical protein
MMEETGNSFLLYCPFRLLCMASAGSGLLALSVYLLLA